MVIQALPGPAEYNEDIIFMCYDNKAYMNTGIQYSSATPIHTVSTTSPASAPNLRKVKDIVVIMSAHGVPCTATASIAYAMDLMAKLKKPNSSGVPRFCICSPPAQPDGGISRLCL